MAPRFLPRPFGEPPREKRDNRGPFQPRFRRLASMKRALGSSFQEVARAGASRRTRINAGRGNQSVFLVSAGAPTGDSEYCDTANELWTLIADLGSFNLGLRWLFGAGVVQVILQGFLCRLLGRLVHYGDSCA